MASAQDNKMVDALTSNVWIGRRIEMPGFQGSVEDVFGGDIKLTIQKDGKCLFDIGGDIVQAKWTLKENEIHIRGQGIDTKGDFDGGHPAIPEQPPILSLYDIESYMVLFYGEDD